MEKADYDRFIEHVTALSIAHRDISSKEWAFNPKAFIEVFRKCNWLTCDELAQCFPRKLLHLKNNQFLSTTTPWSTAYPKANEWALAFNRATRRFGISNSRQRLAHLMSHIIPETGNLALVKEIKGERARYSPYYGRGLIQLTWLEGYQKYGQFRQFAKSITTGPYSALGWNPDDLIALDNSGNHNRENCADSACFYIIQRADMLSHMDRGLSIENAVEVSKDVNGRVSIENLNGLEVRLQSLIYLKDVLLDEPAPNREIPTTFTWRRSTTMTPQIGPDGQPVMRGTPPKPKLVYTAGEHTINVSLQRQKP